MKSPGGVIASAIFAIAFPLLVVFFGWKLMEQKNIKDDRRAALEQEFQAWVEWRGENCRLKGVVTHGQFVCDNGLVFPARADRWGEWRHYPDFIRQAPRDPQAADTPFPKVEPALP